MSADHGLADLWPRGDALMWALRARSRQAKQEASAADGIGPDDWGPLLHALSLDPEPVSTSTLLWSTPYMAQATYEARLSQLHSRGLLEHAPDNSEGFRLTGKGRQLIEAVTQAGRQAMATAQPLPPADLEWLDGVLAGLVARSLEQPTPARIRLEQNRRIAPPPDAPCVVRVEHHLSDLNAYRSAAHIEAWSRHDVSGPAFEILTLAWRGEASSLAELASATARRGHTEAELRAATGELLARGWMTEKDGRYQLTADGRHVRHQVELETDEVSFAPWSSLSVPEVERLRRLLDAGTRALRAQA